MYNKIKTRGFTLIELLVVIAIIGILSAVVLASLNTARAKGADASVKSNLANIRAQAELYYDNQNPNSYGTAVTAVSCASAAAGSMFMADAQIKAAIAEAARSGGGTTRCATNGTDYAISATLKTNTGAAWCIDSSGVAKVIGAVAAGGAGQSLSWSGVLCP